MAVIAMKVLEAKDHPNADALRVYTVGTAHWKPFVVVANLENVYEVGDTVNYPTAEAGGL